MNIPFLKKITSKFKKESFKNEFSFRPHHDWRIVIRAFFVCGIGLILMSFYLSYKINNEEIFNSNNKGGGEGLVTINQKSLEKVLASFQANEEKIKKIKTGQFTDLDPSKQN